MRRTTAIANKIIIPASIIHTPTYPTLPRRLSIGLITWLSVELACSCLFKTVWMAADLYRPLEVMQITCFFLAKQLLAYLITTRIYVCKFLFVLPHWRTYVRTYMYLLISSCLNSHMWSAPSPAVKIYTERRYYTLRSRKPEVLIRVQLAICETS